MSKLENDLLLAADHLETALYEAGMTDAEWTGEARGRGSQVELKFTTSHSWQGYEWMTASLHSAQR